MTRSHLRRLWHALRRRLRDAFLRYGRKRRGDERDRAFRADDDAQTAGAASGEVRVADVVDELRARRG